MALYVRRWVFILYTSKFFPITKQFEEDIFSVEVFVSPVSEQESLISFAIIFITYDISQSKTVD